MIRFLVVALGACALSMPAFAQDLDEATSARLREAVRIGQDINAHDQSAWHVTDALLARNPDVTNRRITYVTERIDPQQVRTTFLLTEGDKVSQFFSGVVDGSTVVSVMDYTRDLSPPDATPDQVARADALTTARNMYPQGLCGLRPNFVVLPSEIPGALDVYALVPETRSDVVQIGGHVRITVDANGFVLPAMTKAFSNSCLAVETDPAAKALEPEDKMIFVTIPSNIGDTPTEMHVFKSISHDLPIYVGTSSGLWAVEGARIRLLEASTKAN